MMVSNGSNNKIFDDKVLISFFQVHYSFPLFLFFLFWQFQVNVWIWWQMVLPIVVEDVKQEVKILQELQGHEKVVQFYNAFEDDSNV